MSILIDYRFHALQNFNAPDMTMIIQIAMDG